jgi:hypothetical protein
MLDLEDQFSDGGEADLRRQITEIQARRVAVGEAYRSIHLGIGLVLFQIGHARVVWLQTLILASDAVIALASRANPDLTALAVVAVLASLVVLWLVSLFVEDHMEEWLAEYNARLDGEIRRLLSAGADEEAGSGT